MFTFPVFFAISVLVGGAVGIVVNNRSARRRAASYAPGFKDPLTPNRGERLDTLRHTRHHHLHGAFGYALPRQNTSRGDDGARAACWQRHAPYHRAQHARR